MCDFDPGLGDSNELYSSPKSCKKNFCSELRVRGRISENSKSRRFFYRKKRRFCGRQWECEITFFDATGRGNENLDPWLSADTLNLRTALRNRTLDTFEDGQNFPADPDRMGVRIALPHTPHHTLHTPHNTLHIPHPDTQRLF